MSSKRKIDSARSNGAKSHGPKTEAGRQISSRNAVTHGLYSSSVVLSRESREQHQEMLEAYIRQFQPDGQSEFDLLEEMAAAKWRQRRLWAIEADLIEDEMIRQKEKLDNDGSTYDEITPLSFAYRELSESPSLPFLTRHESRLERAYSRALKNLLDLQRLRKVAATSAQQNLQQRTQSQIRTPPTQPVPPQPSPVFPPPTTHNPPPARPPAEPTHNPPPARPPAEPTHNPPPARPPAEPTPLHSPSGCGMLP